MMFKLPAEYDDMDKIPTPTNPAIQTEMIYQKRERYIGTMAIKISKSIVRWQRI